MQQTSDQLDRGQIGFVALDPNRRPPLSRDERTQLIAARMSADIEAEEAKTRGGELYADNTRLADELRRMRARNIELEAQVKDRLQDVKQAQKERDTANANLHDVTAELARVTPLIGKQTVKTSSVEASSPEAVQKWAAEQAAKKP